MDILRQTKDPENPNYDPFSYRLVRIDLNSFLETIYLFRLFFERDQILEHVQETMKAFDNDVCLLYYLKLIKTLRVKETDLRLEIVFFFHFLLLILDFN